MATKVKKTTKSKSKPGRVCRAPEARLTARELSLVRRCFTRRKMSFADWLVSMAAADDKQLELDKMSFPK